VAVCACGADREELTLAREELRRETIRAAEEHALKEELQLKHKVQPPPRSGMLVIIVVHRWRYWGDVQDALTAKERELGAKAAELSKAVSERDWYHTRLDEANKVCNGTLHGAMYVYTHHRPVAWPRSWTSCASRCATRWR
jgi:hypothetical protein